MRGIILQVADGKTLLMMNNGTMRKVAAKTGHSVGAELDVANKGGLGRIIRFAALAAAAFAVVVLTYAWNAPSFKLYVDINPGLELSVNRFNVVIAANGTNAQGDEMLNGTPAAGKSVDDAIVNIVSTASKGGYLSGDNAVILLTYVGEGRGSGEAMLRECTSVLNHYFEQHNIVGIGLETFIADEELMHKALEHDISPGKMYFIMQLIEADPSLTIDGLKHATMEDIITNIAEKKNEAQNPKPDPVVTPTIPNPPKPAKPVKPVASSAPPIYVVPADPSSYSDPSSHNDPSSAVSSSSNSSGSNADNSGSASGSSDNSGGTSGSSSGNSSGSGSGSASGSGGNSGGSSGSGSGGSSSGPTHYVSFSRPDGWASMQDGVTVIHERKGTADFYMLKGVPFTTFDAAIAEFKASYGALTQNNVYGPETDATMNKVACRNLTYTCDLLGKPHKLSVTFYPYEGVVYAFICSAPVAEFDTYAADFEALLSSVSLTS